jgi:uncharacterized protein YdhG (YjbR/CyaY superfamily)
MHYHGAMTVEDYIAAAPQQSQPILQAIRKMALERCPDAEETISYKMPALKAGRVFFYYAAFNEHIGIYPPVKAPSTLIKALQPYRGPKGNLQFPYASPMPYDLIGQVIDALYASRTTTT